MARKAKVEITVDAAFPETIRRLPVGLRVLVVGIDVGLSTGVAILDMETRWRWSTQDTPALAMRALAMALGGNLAAVVVREAPYTASRSQMMAGVVKITPSTLFSMGESSGYAARALEGMSRTDRAEWRPMASSWRSVLGLNRDVDGGGAGREAVNRRVHMWAEATSGFPMRKHDGSPAFDQANACGLAEAGAHLVRSTLRVQQRGSR